MTATDPDAPVQAAATADIAAGVEDVWAVLSDVAAWESIYPEIKDVTVEGPVAAGTSFSFRTGPGRIEAEIGICAAPERLAFTGSGMGATSTYVFELAGDDTQCTLTAQQSMSGLAARTMRRMLQAIADSSLHDWTSAIKVEAEAR